MITRENARALGRKGGTSTVRRHGQQHMREIGTAGQAALYELRLGGDPDLAREYFRHLGRIGGTRRAAMEEGND